MGSLVVRYRKFMDFTLDGVIYPIPDPFELLPKFSALCSTLSPQKDIPLDSTSPISSRLFYKQLQSLGIPTSEIDLLHAVYVATQPRAPTINKLHGYYVYCYLHVLYPNVFLSS
jgi:hypothetical protein